MNAILGLIFAVAGCAATRPTSTARSSDDLGPIPVEAALFDASALTIAGASGGDYVAMGLPFAPVHAVKERLEKALDKKLKDRGEAHVTLVTPPEHKALATRVKHGEMLALANDAQLQAGSYQIPCVGRGRIGNGGAALETYYLVVQNDALLAYRQQLAALFVARGGQADRFKPALFHPHATLGFTKRDLHLEEGVVKDLGSCIAPIDP